MGDARTPFDPAATSVYLQKPSFPYGGAGLVMSARDYDRFLHMLQDGGALDGVRIMKPETAALAMSNLLPKGVTFEGIGGGTGGTAAAVRSEEQTSELQSLMRISHAVFCLKQK